MKFPQSAVDVLRRMQAENMPDTARIIGIATEYIAGGATRPVDDPDVDVVTVPCRINPMAAANTIVAGQELPDSDFVVALPLTLRGILNKDHEIEITSAEFGWTKRVVVDRVSDHYTHEVMVKAYCSERGE